jgi:hypothetical protein
MSRVGDRVVMPESGVLNYGDPMREDTSRVVLRCNTWHCERSDGGFSPPPPPPPLSLFLSSPALLPRCFGFSNSRLINRSITAINSVESFYAISPPWISSSIGQHYVSQASERALRDCEIDIAKS